MKIEYSYLQVLHIDEFWYVPVLHVDGRLVTIAHQTTQPSKEGALMLSKKAAERLAAKNPGAHVSEGCLN